ncbi:hypothetical protein ABEB36_012339 [Hypothenemus hampei]|uniref:G-protein coupled receptors family 1 profile domain-containing protein n=1 Tax=Hypothenemus hampei TaxID=57062 RepID=A0ABD1EB53_HYPHA
MDFFNETIMNNRTVESLDPMAFPQLRIPFTIVYLLIFLTGVIGNISTCVVIAKNKSMHTATNYYLFSLAISDMLLLISGLPPEMYRIWSPDTYIFGHVICFLQGFSAETSANATVSTIVFFVAPMTLITVLYVLIGRQLKKSTAKRPSLTQHNSNGTTMRYSNTCNGTEAAKKRLRNTQAQNRVVKMLIAVVAAFFICWAPFHSQRLLAVYLADASQEAQTTYLQMYFYLEHASGVLYYLSTCINPLLYHIMSNKYRNAFKKTFHNFCSRRNRSRSYVAAPLRATTKKYPENFLGAALHQAQTGDVTRTTSNFPWHKPPTKLTPQTSQTSFSSSKIETSNSQLEREVCKKLMLSEDHEPSCASLKLRFMKLFKSGLVQSCNISQSRLNKGSNSISNSSLKDTDEMDLICADLVKQMKQVNDVL